MLGGFGTSPLELMAADAMLRGEIWCEEFKYSAAFITGTDTALGASAAATASIKTDSGPDFVVQEMNFVAWTAVGTIIASPDYLMLFTIDASGRQTMNQPQPITTLCGNYANGNVPSRLPFPRLIQAESTISITLTNRTATACNRGDLVLRGFKVFYLSGTRREIFHVL